MPEELEHRLDAAWARARDVPLCVAYSGGHDSGVLLHLLAGLRGGARSLRAIHVDHGLHADSADWARHCADRCARLGVPLEIVRVDVATDSGTGPEAAARQARYAALADRLASGERAVAAHHLDDQAETVLLKLLRGAGPDGLGGMRELRPLGRGWLWRPLLQVPRAELAACALANGLRGLDDPSNASPQLARSFLRTDILPRLRRHWPAAATAIGHTARHSREAADYIGRQAAQALDALQDAQGSLDAQGWLALHPALRAPVLERWLHRRGLPAPTVLQREELERQLREAATDRLPQAAWPGACVRAWRRRLHAMAPQPEPPRGWSTNWSGAPLNLPGGGRLVWAGERTATDVPPLQVRLGESGVHLRPHGDRHRRALRDLFQRASIPPWQRRTCPLLYATDDTLLAVADLWTTEAGEQLFARLGLRPVWQRGA